MRVLITGATGLVGQAIVDQCLDRGIDVHYLTTSMSKIDHRTNYKGFFWEPSKDRIDLNCFEGVDTIINLAGAGLTKRWTGTYKQKILNSRIQSVTTLYKGLQESNHKVSHIISASAIGIYPDSLSEYYEESYEETDRSFLGEVVQKWEEAIQLLQKQTKRLSVIRIGLVLSSKGGALPEFVKPLRYYTGVVFGTGEHWQSWIHIDDLANMFLFIIDQQLTGIYNGVAPNPVTHKKFIQTLINATKRPLLRLKIPKKGLRLLLGEMACILYASQRVSSKKIQQEGFHFHFTYLQMALNDLLVK